MTRDQIITLLNGADPLAAARAAGIDRPERVRVSRGTPPAEWFADDRDEGPLPAHEAAHAQGRPSEAVVRYGAGVPAEDIADRLLGLADLAARSPLLRVVRPEPAEGGADRPGSWGVEDLLVIIATRAALPAHVEVQPSWARLGAGACQVALAFGATGWRMPDDDTADPAHLAASLGLGVEEDAVP